MEITMNKETTPKERIVVLEKGKGIDIGPLALCCAAAWMPIRSW